MADNLDDYYRKQSVWSEDNAFEDELDLAEELADLHADPVFAEAPSVEMGDLDDATADLYATSDDEE